MGSMADCRSPRVALFRCRSVPSRRCAAELQGDPASFLSSDNHGRVQSRRLRPSLRQGDCSAVNERARRQACPNWKAPFRGSPDRFENENTAVRRFALSRYLPVPLGAGAHFDHPACSYSVAQADHAFGLGAVLAAEKCAFLFEPVTDDVNTAIRAARSERMDSALKAIEGVGPSVHVHLKRFVVVISARFALCHDAAIRLENSA